MNSSKQVVGLSFHYKELCRGFCDESFGQFFCCDFKLIFAVKM